jgi:hypothetical protein
MSIVSSRGEQNSVEGEEERGRDERSYKVEVMRWIRWRPACTAEGSIKQHGAWSMEDGRYSHMLHKPVDKLVSVSVSLSFRWTSQSTETCTHQHTHTHKAVKVHI